MNPLDQYPSVRRFLYFVQWVTTGLTGIGGLYFATTDASTPNWYTLTVAILAFAWSYTGVTAQVNTPSPSTPKNEHGYYQGSPLLWVLAVVGIVLLILVLVGGVHTGR